jgi:hypothetical protein
MFSIATLAAVSGGKPFHTRLETAFEAVCRSSFSGTDGQGETGRIATHLAEAGWRHVTDRPSGFNPVSGK